MSDDPRLAGPPGLGRCTGYVFGHAGLSLLEDVEAALGPHGIQMRHVGVMLVLEATERPVSQQEISAVLALDPARMVTIVDQLEERRYVERKRNPDDRRRYMVTLRPAGRRALERAMKVVDQAEADFFEPLGESEREQLGQAARKLMAPRWSLLTGDSARPESARSPA